MARLGGVRLAATIVISITIKLLSVHGRKCVCTTKTCIETGKDTCGTRFACYTELILTDEGQGNTTTRGCTEDATPLLCENPPRSEDTSTGYQHRVRLPHLRCCDSHDYCNRGALDPLLQDHRRPLSTQNRDPVVSSGDSQGKSSDPPDRYRDKKLLDSSAFTGDGSGLNSLTLRQVKPLHVAALILALAALISVLAACYVVTRFLRSNPYPASSQNVN
ncbi:uncharacterized protein LOC124176941 [Neodiprion fabricii]|uniref:uncharacterized protein LOC124176941 n=1 Tax=Neodiprion fabricii TaxID=2872261 RepID=UPI001ED94B66|nr:uncharacterized protein LOC124176941 [Neodiprion fabricii]